MDGGSDSGNSTNGNSSTNSLPEPWNDPKNPEILIFHPTTEEFSDFQRYIKYMESRNAHYGGIAKIVPPPGWKPRKRDYADCDQIVVNSPIRQVVQQTNRGSFEVRNCDVDLMTWKELKQLAAEYQDFDFGNTMDETERNFWRQISQRPPVYGADNPGTLFDEDQNVWNISRLPSILDEIVDEEGNEIKVQGVNTPYLYFGMWRAFFGWHTEDMDLYSINLIHQGASKFWYAVPPHHGRKFERCAATMFSDLHRICPSFLRHKSVMISHSVLKSHSVPFNRVMQNEGEIIVTFPYGYHAGFNCGLNIAESTNFATERWIEYGKYCSVCACQEDNVRIDMGIFVKQHQPDKWSAWQDGTERGRHPEEDKHLKSLVPPTSGPAAELAAKGKRRRGGGGMGTTSGGRKMMMSSSNSSGSVTTSLLPPPPPQQSEVEEQPPVYIPSSSSRRRRDELARKFDVLKKEKKRSAVSSSGEEEEPPVRKVKDWEHNYAAGRLLYYPDMPRLSPTNLAASPYRHLLPGSSSARSMDSPFLLDDGRSGSLSGTDMFDV